MVVSSPGPSPETPPPWVEDAEAEPSFQNRFGRLYLGPADSSNLAGSSPSGCGLARLPQEMTPAPLDPTDHVPFLYPADLVSPEPIQGLSRQRSLWVCDTLGLTEEGGLLGRAVCIKSC